MFNFLRNICFPQWLHQFTFPPTVHRSYLPTTSSPTLVFCLYISLSNRCEGVSHCGFDLHVSPMTEMLSIFSCVSWPSVCLFGKISVPVLGPFFNQVVYIFLLLSSMTSLYILDPTLHWIYCLQISSPIDCMSFNFLSYEKNNPPICVV